MISYIAFLSAIGSISALPSQKSHHLSDKFIQEINSKQSTWKAGRNFEIEEYELFKILASGVKRSNTPMMYKKIYDESEEIPESFDAREAWPECADVIGMIRDQSKCGSCWAFAAVECMSDRICIHSTGLRKLLVSSEDLITCGEVGGCHGGSPLAAFQRWIEHGIVTGGLYNHTEQGCKSYFLPPCEDHPNKCTNYVDAPSCKEQCDDFWLNYSSQKTYGKTRYTFAGEKQIQLEILKNGPVVAIMEVYTDFACYKSGIYQHACGDWTGGHAVKILGWGVEDDVPYWLIANSWNERWGENGYFRIVRGRNEVGIESNIDAALPDFSRF